MPLVIARRIHQGDVSFGGLMRVFSSASLIALLGSACTPDPGGLTVHNANPRAEITSHADGDDPEAGLRTFTGTVEDPDHDADELELTWLVDGAEACPPITPDASGNTSCEVFLESGERTVTLQVEDPLGGLGSDKVTLDVQAYGEPWAEISSPLAGNVYYSDQLVELAGQVGDAADNAVDLEVWWESSIDGELSLNAEPDESGLTVESEYLSEGQHLLELWVRNSGHNTAYDSVTIDVGPSNSAPSCAILAPEDGTEVEYGELVTLEGLVSDPDVPADWLTATWSSQLDGELGEQTPPSSGELRWPTSELSVGTHLITLAVEDENGASCSTDILLTVRECDIVWYADADGDGFGEAASTTTGCDQPSGYVDDDQDCDDADAAVHPDASEVCNELDDDCDGDIDDADSSLDSSTASTWYADGDADGYGDTATSTIACAQPSGFVADSTDCDDGDTSIHPAATEVCNGVDDDCDGATDDADASLDTSTATLWYADADSDGYGDASVSTLLCDQPTGTVADAGDCDDGSASTFPGADEYCDGTDTDCDGTLDEHDALDASTWYADSDGDGYGDPLATTLGCTAPSGYLADASDCDDGSATTFPGADEYCDGIDSDCDGTLDEADALDASTWYADADGDGYGDPLTTDHACSAPSGYVGDDTDCDDAASTVNLGATESCNSIDDDCDGLVDDDDSSLVSAGVWYSDSDGDGYGDASTTTSACTAPSGYLADATDCDDGDSDVHPGADEYCNGVDDDCDGDIDGSDSVDADTWYADLDIDGFGDPLSAIVACEQPSGYLTDGTDCDDHDNAVNTAASELCDGVDNDCDGLTDDATALDATTWNADNDGDGYGDSSSTVLACSQPSGFVADSADCLDSDSTVNPGALEICGNGLDDDCDDDGAECEFDSVMSMSDADLFFIGEASNDEAGVAMGGGGDVNGDGYDDIIIGADRNDLTNDDAGASYLFLGGSSAYAPSVAGATARYSGEGIDDVSGTSVAILGDVNGDGFDDIGIGATQSITTGSGVGVAYLVLGSAAPYDTPLGSADARFFGESSRGFAGCSISGAGDYNSDGTADFIVGADGANKAYLILGGGTWGDDSLTNADAVFSGENSGDLAGCSVAGVGDVNGDGIDDVMIGAEHYGTTSPYCGAAYLVLGGLVTDLDLADADAYSHGVSYQNSFGSAVAGGGDIDGDGLADMVVGSWGYGTYSYQGAASVYLGTSSYSGAALSRAAYIIGEDADDRAGYSVAVLQDLNGDGFDEVAVGAPVNSSAAEGSGAVYILLGGSVVGTTSLSSSDHRFYGDSAYDRCGSAVGTAGDFDGDGFGDFIVGAIGVDGSLGSEGAVFLFYGGGG